MSAASSPSEASKRENSGKRAAGCFFTVFMLVGLGFTAVFAWPVVEIIQARNWQQVPCTILTSEVQTSRGSKGGSTYSVAVTFEYFVEEQRYTSDRYKFMGGSSSGRSGKEEIVARLQPGTQTFCYVNRRNPSEAVIERGFTSDLFFVFIPLIFVAIGAVGLVFTVFYKGKPKSPHARSSMSGPVAASTVDSSAPARGPKGKLKASTSPGLRFGCVTGIALFWNGIVSIFVFGDGSMDGCTIVFMIPFVLVGLGLIGAVGYCFLGLFNPRPTLRMSGDATLGESLDIEWEVAGNAEKIKLFTITLEGREEATYRRGTSTSTDKSVFARMELVRVTHPKEMKRGRTKAAIPADTMHTFKSKNNKFLWQLKVEGEIPKWPDVGEEYEIEVKPQRPGASR
jgi:hypothetical protein